jgi:acetyltransferase-like isoleucine patch superfamily enzyme
MTPIAGAPIKPIDPCKSLQLFLLLDMLVRMFIWSTAFTFATAAIAAIGFWPRESLLGGGLAVAWKWSQVATNWIVIFNFSYVAELVVLRLLVPTPKPGVYSTARDIDFRNKRDRELIKASFIATLTKARYEAPFPAFLVFHISNIAPMRWLMGPIFGPRSKSCYVTEPLILDPPFVEIGRNVVIGSHASIAGHIQVPNMVQIKKTVIEDDVLIGANAIVFGGVTLKRGCMIAAGSVVPPYTTVGEYEYWSGVPAVKIRDMSPVSTAM